MLDNARLHELLGDEPVPGRQLMFDLSLLRAVDAATLEVLMRARDRSTADRRRVCVVSASRSALHALRLLCLEPMFPNFVDQIAALDWLRSEPDRRFRPAG